jgi:ribulose-phosphate 3-epimerase
MPEIKVSASILNSDFAHLADEIGKAEKIGVDMLHLDIMDGVFVPNISIGPPVIECIRKNTDLFLDVHLMITEPDRLLDSFIESGADSINVHVEECLHLDRTLNYIKEAGKKAAVALNPSTPVGSLENILGLVDMILVMTVNPGFGGQKFIVEMIHKIAQLKQMIEDYKKRTKQPGKIIDIQVDGGIDLDTAPRVVGAGATVLSIGTAIFRSDDPGGFIEKLRESVIPVV